MPSLEQITAYLYSKAGQANLAGLYGSEPGTIKEQQERYSGLIDEFGSLFPHHLEADFFSAPGRTEVGGNHTDHNAGRILAAAVDLDVIALAAPNDQDIVRVHSQGYPPSIFSLDDLAIVENERYTSTALIRGVCARFKQLGYAIGGFDAVVTSTVPKGSGLSSSAAYEVLMAAILSHTYNQDEINEVTLAQIGQYAENEYFGKPCGLMDQTTSAVGGFVTIDFKDFDNPVVTKVNYDFEASGHTLVIVDTAGDHADLTDEYTALENEMKAVAYAMGGQVLREFSEQSVLETIPHLRDVVGDRAILRAIHFYRDDARVVEQVQALQMNDFDRFLQLINESGQSSWMLCQNCYSPRAIKQQGISMALTLSEAILGERGAWRVHGGGFAGTIQAFVPNALLPEYVGKIEQVFGTGSCHAVHIRPAGVIKMPV